MRPWHCAALVGRGSSGLSPRSQRGSALLCLWAVVGLCVVAGALFAGFAALNERAMRTNLDGAAGLAPRLRQLEVRNIELLREQASLERQAAFSREAYGELQGTVQALQDQLFELQQELSLYRALLDPDQSSAGLRFHGISLAQLDDLGERFKLEIILMQLGTEHRVRGSLGLILSGRQKTGAISNATGHAGEASQALDAEALGVPGSGLDFDFKHFERIEVVVELPRGFDAQVLEVTARPDGDTVAAASMQEHWPLIRRVAQ